MKKLTVGLILVTAAIAATAAKPSPALHLETRGAGCEAIEFAELNTFSRTDLESMTCSYDLGIHDAKAELHDIEAMPASGEIKNRLQSRTLERMSRCSTGSTRSADLLRRKFKVEKDCKKMPPSSRT